MNSLVNLTSRWQDYRHENPSIRIRTAAADLGVSEAELVQTGVDGQCTRLGPITTSMIEALQTLGQVMALTRSNALVHELHGHFEGTKFHGNTAMSFRPGLDTRYFLERWAFAFAVQEGERHSLQFFDWQGQAVHKLFMQKDTNIDAFQAFVNKHKLNNQRDLVSILRTPTTPTTTLPERDPAFIRQRWSKIKDVHEGNRIIKNYGHSKAIAYEDLGTEYAQPLATESVEQLLRSVADQQHPIILFGMNAGAVQSYAGTISNIVMHGPWFNILDPGFNIHLMPKQIGQVWHIRKPTSEGTVNSLSVLDFDGDEIMVITDHRMRGECEAGLWNHLLQQLPALASNHL